VIPINNKHSLDVKLAVLQYYFLVSRILKYVFTCKFSLLRPWLMCSSPSSAFGISYPKMGSPCGSDIQIELEVSVYPRKKSIMKIPCGLSTMSTLLNQETIAHHSSREYFHFQLLLKYQTRFTFCCSFSCLNCF
jgi:hypothetical protein